MVGRRDAELRLRAEPLVARELLGIATDSELAHLFVEALRPVVFRRLVAESRAKVVHHVAAADEENALVAKRRETLAERSMRLGRRGAVDAELHDGDVGLWEHPDEDGPRAVIESPVTVEHDRRRREDLGEVLCEI